ncbi:MAG: hypothetical protein WC002_02135 [Candidatus Muiribacteriota bacterium]
MKKLSLYIVFILFLLFNHTITQAFNVDEINKLVEQFASRGITDIKIIYDWGDGNTDTVDIKEFGNPVNHYYEKEGVYNIVTKLIVNNQGQIFEQVLETKTMNYKPEKIDYDVSVVIPEKTETGKSVTLSAKLIINEKDIEIKDPVYQWFFDTELDQFDEGQQIEKIFRQPNGNEKPSYTVKLRVFTRYRRKGEQNIWLPLESITEHKILVARNEKIEIEEISRFLKYENGEFTSPFFIVLKDNSFYNNEDFYRKTNIFYRPVIRIGNKSYNGQFVSLKKESENGNFFNRLTYMIEFDNIDYEIQKTTDDKFFIEFDIRVSDPLGLIEQTIKLPVI